MRLMHSLCAGLLLGLAMCFGFASIAAAAPFNPVCIGKHSDPFVGSRLDPLPGYHLTFAMFKGSSGFERSTPLVVGHRLVKHRSLGAVSVARYAPGYVIA